MLISSNLTAGGYSVVAQGMTWGECRAVLAAAGPGAFIDGAGHLRQLVCMAEQGDTEA